MKQILFLILITACSSSHDNKDCELECVNCEKVKFTCSSDKADIEIINSKAVL